MRSYSMKPCRLLAVGALVLTLAAGGAAAAEKTTLVIGMDISDARTFDPGRMAEYSPPLTVHAAYGTLVTMDAGDYETIRPAIAESWERTDDGTAWVFKLRKDVKFASGNPLTAADVKFSLDRLVNLKDQPASYAENLKSTDVIDDYTVRLNAVDKNQPLLSMLTAPSFSIYDSKLLREHGGSAGPNAETEDSATDWLNQNSAGSGAYALTGWSRNTEIVLERNPYYWRGMPPFERVIIKHIGDSAAQLLTLKRGDIDVAMNLTPDQIASIEGDPGVSIHEATSLDYMYMTLTSNPDFNEAVANQACRQAIAHAIDYTGIIEGLLGGYAIRPATFIPVGLPGSTEEIAKKYRYETDIESAKQFLGECGKPDGFSFELNYADAEIAGTSYGTVAQKIASDLGKLGVTAELAPLNQVTLIERYRGGKMDTTSVLTFWNPDAAETYLWTHASVYRVADRVHWKVPQKIRDIVSKAAGESDPEAQKALYEEYTQALVDQANYIILFQPVYRIATGTQITDYQPTAAGWHVNLFDVKPVD